MANLYTDFYIGNDVYIDEEEDALLHHYSGDKVLKQEEIRDAMFFLTTPIRENILSWYPFKRGSILELGCGCGCITGTLCDKAKSVVSVDQSLQRAKITYNRHKSRDNLEVYAGNITEIVFEKQFDYIVVVGVLEYARRFFNEKPEDQQFLRIIRKLLKPDGILLLAIENRYGIKYFGGALEDHLREKYVSIQGYAGKDVQTYGKDELTRLLNMTGYSAVNFFYPFPDYKLPSVIFSDKRKPSEEEASQLVDYYYGQGPLFDSTYAKIGLFCENDYLGVFANSFLVEAGVDNSKFTNISYVRFHNKRCSRYNVYTALLEDDLAQKWYMKFPLSKEAEKHLLSYQAIHDKLLLEGYPIDQVTYNDKLNSWQTKMIEGLHVSERLRQVWSSAGKEGVLKEVAAIIDFLAKNCQHEIIVNPIIEDLFELYPNGTNIIKHGLMDFNAGNLLYVDGIGYCVIDQEWSCEKQIPLDYLVMCSLGVIYWRNSVVRLCVSIQELLLKYGLDDRRVEVLKKISRAYFNDERGLDDGNLAIFLDQLQTCGPSDFAVLNENYNRVVATLDEREKQVKELSEGYNRVVSLLQARDKQVKDLSENYNRVVALLEEKTKENKLFHSD